MNIELTVATQADIPVMQNLMQLYLYDFTEFDNADPDAQGLYSYEYLPLYWIEPERHPFLIRVEGQWAGFVLVRKVIESGVQPYYSIAEFFVMRKYRRQGVGRQAAHMTFDRFPGRWIVAQEETNRPAQTFWRKIIAEYTNGAFEEGVPASADWHGPFQTFISQSQGS
jgi:predicted acetyltransferase